jgi:osmoprotectant transport system substrate-binding protein
VNDNVQHNALMRGDANMSAVRFTGTELTSVLDAPPTRESDIYQQFLLLP